MASPHRDAPSLASPRSAPRRAFRPALLPLEGRALLSSLPAAPTADEQYMLQLLNRARANPTAEAQRLIALAQTDPVLKNAAEGWDLSGMLRQAQAAGPLPPLAFNTRLIAAARDHDAEVLAANDQTHAPAGFLTTGAGGLVAGDGQVYYPVGNAAWSTGENVFAFSRNVRGTSTEDYVNYYHAGLMIDWGNPGYGHLKNILAPGPSQAQARGMLPFSEVGIGLLTDANPTAAPASNPDYAANRGLDVGPVIVTQEFAWKTGNAFLTGAIFRDADGDGFYSPGEGLGGVTVKAIGLHGEGTYGVPTWDSGGYSLQLPPGTYSVTASGPSAPAKAVVVTVGQDNVGWDVVYPAQASRASATAISAPVATGSSLPKGAVGKTRRKATHAPKPVRRKVHVNIAVKRSRV